MADPILTDETINSVFTPELRAALAPDWPAIVAAIRQSPDLVNIISLMRAKGAKYDLGKRGDGARYLSQEKTVLVDPNTFWTQPKNPDGTNQFPEAQPVSPNRFAVRCYIEFLSGQLPAFGFGNATQPDASLPTTNAGRVLSSVFVVFAVPCFSASVEGRFGGSSTNPSASPQTW